MKTKDNIYIPAPLGNQIKWWKKNGSFNESLYLKLLEIRAKS